MFNQLTVLLDCKTEQKNNQLDLGQQMKEVGFALANEAWTRCLSQLFIVTTGELTLYLIEAHFNIFANRADPDQAALVRAA